jgi:hypothetical protein
MKTNQELINIKKKRFYTLPLQYHYITLFLNSYSRVTPEFVAKVIFSYYTI